MYYRLVSLSGLSALAEAVPEEAAAPGWPCPGELAEAEQLCPAWGCPACFGLHTLPWAPGLPEPSAPKGWDCCADGKVVLLPLGCV